LLGDNPRKGADCIDRGGYRLRHPTQNNVVGPGQIEKGDVAFGRSDLEIARLGVNTHLTAGSQSSIYFPWAITTAKQETTDASWLSSHFTNGWEFGALGGVFIGTIGTKWGHS
jgi:hypothetical protein